MGVLSTGPGAGSGRSRRVAAAVLVILAILGTLAAIAAGLHWLPMTPRVSDLRSRPLSGEERRRAQDGVRRNEDWAPVVRKINGVIMSLVPSGCFSMGSSDSEVAAAVDSCDRFFGEGKCPYDFAATEQPVHEVCFERPFWIGRTEVTNRDYGSSSSAGGSGVFRGSAWPRERVSWDEAATFCAVHGLRLPSEAEWEYAARGPAGWIYAWGNDFDLEKVISGRLAPSDVGSARDAVGWVGTYDMSGGVAEWTADWLAPYEGGPRRNPSDAPGSGRRVVRGGSWFSFAAFFLRTAQREGYDPGLTSSVIGFRCAADFE
jgi:formylglycine-generating enzyme required for sulfatase activity